MKAVRTHFASIWVMNDCLLSFNKFCEVSKIDEPLTSVKICKAPIFMAYLFWRVRNSRIKKESSVIACWKVLSMIYVRLAERYMDDSVLYELVMYVFIFALLFVIRLYWSGNSGSRRTWPSILDLTIQKRKSQGFLLKIYALFRMAIGFAMLRRMLMNVSEFKCPPFWILLAVLQLGQKLSLDFCTKTSSSNYSLLWSRAGHQLLW